MIYVCLAIGTLIIGILVLLFALMQLRNADEIRHDSPEHEECRQRALMMIYVGIFFVVLAIVFMGIGLLVEDKPEKKRHKRTHRTSSSYSSSRQVVTLPQRPAYVEVTPAPLSSPAPSQTIRLPPGGVFTVMT